MQFTSTARGARLARRTAVSYLEQWGFPPESDVCCTVALVVAELAANAVRHGRVPGRNFLLSVVYEVGARRIRVEVSDACPELPPADPSMPGGTEESGAAWCSSGCSLTGGAVPRSPAGKTVWAECLADPAGPR
ncbi:ATP-binding protein [Streptomyces sp. M10(2022)]